MACSGLTIQPKPPMSKRLTAALQSFRNKPFIENSTASPSHRNTVFVRDPKGVRRCSRRRSAPAKTAVSYSPFEVDGLPFLEVHIVKHLVQKGSDRIINTVALCPNCHQRCHRSSDRDVFNSRFYSKIDRLIRE